jgi:hypothetical protein
MEKLVVEIELSEEESAKFKELVETRCLDSEKYLKNLLAGSITAVLEKRERAFAHLRRKSAADDA